MMVLLHVAMQAISHSVCDDGWFKGAMTCHQTCEPLERLICPLSAPYDVIRGRFPKRLVMANHTTPGGMSWQVRLPKPVIIHTF